MEIDFDGGPDFSGPALVVLRFLMPFSCFLDGLDMPVPSACCFSAVYVLFIGTRSTTGNNPSVCKASGRDSFPSLSIWPPPL
ncbi:MAG: hypothetical protein M3512_17975 [Bacteroidota bacterium]|nr:hypothetical protein [Bacteroidota bacterium]